jgi:hypothetical protein
VVERVDGRKKELRKSQSEHCPMMMKEVRIVEDVKKNAPKQIMSRSLKKTKYSLNEINKKDK